MAGGNYEEDTMHCDGIICKREDFISSVRKVGLLFHSFGGRNEVGRAWGGAGGGSEV